MQIKSNCKKGALNLNQNTRGGVLHPFWGTPYIYIEDIENVIHDKLLVTMRERHSEFSH